MSSLFLGVYLPIHKGDAKMEHGSQQPVMDGVGELTTNKLLGRLLVMRQLVLPPVTTIWSTQRHKLIASLSVVLPSLNASLF